MDKIIKVNKKEKWQKIDPPPREFNRPDLVTWRSYKGWFRPWLVGIGLNPQIFEQNFPAKDKNFEED